MRRIKRRHSHVFRTNHSIQDTHCTTSSKIKHWPFQLADQQDMFTREGLACRLVMGYCIRIYYGSTVCGVTGELDIPGPCPASQKGSHFDHVERLKYSLQMKTRETRRWPHEKCASYHKRWCTGLQTSKGTKKTSKYFHGSCGLLLAYFWHELMCVRLVSALSALLSPSFFSISVFELTSHRHSHPSCRFACNTPRRE